MDALLNNQTAIREQFLPFALPSIGEAEINEVIDTLRSGWITTGPKVREFENHFASYVKARCAIGVNSCTAGLLTALTALGIKPGDEVIVPALTFCATANVVVQLGAVPKLVDVGPDFEIDPRAVERAITPFTKAIMPVHFAGQACDLSAIYEIASAHNLAVVEDAAHAVGTTYRGERIGSDRLACNYAGLRRATVFSFYANKNMTTGEGGMITTDDDELSDEMRILALHGMSRDAWKRYTNSGSWFYEVVVAGYKHNMTDIAASLGIHQLRRLDDFIKVRQRYAKIYDAGLADLDVVRTPIQHADRNHVFHLYVIQLELAKLQIDRRAFIEALKQMNIGASVHFIPLHLHPFYRDFFRRQPQTLTRAESLYDRVVSLPLYPGMSEQDVDDVIEAVRHIALTNRR